MAFKDGGYRLWDRHNPEQQKLVYDTPRYRDLLKENEMLLKFRFLGRNPMIWAYLMKYDIISDDMRDNLDTMSTSESISRLINYLRTEQMWKLHGFFKAIYDTNQEHLLGALGLNLDDYAPSTAPVKEPEELALLGDVYVEAYRKACSGGTQKVCKCRVMLVGHGGVGKTSLKNHIIDNELVTEEPSQPTNSIDADSKVYVTKIKGWQHHEDDDEYIQSVAEYIIDVVDEQIRKIRPEDEETNASSVGPGIEDEELTELIDDLRNTNVGEIPAKIEKAVRRIMQERANKRNIDEELDVVLLFWDFGGQGVFYTTHKTFLTRRSIYVVVLDLSMKLDTDVPTLRSDRVGRMVPDTSCPKTAADYLDYWCSCVHTFVEPKSRSGGAEDSPVCTPAIVIVGTHKDKCTQDEVRSYEEAIWDLVEDKPYADHIHKRIFMITNMDSDEKEVTELRKTIVSLAEDQALYLPLSWVEFKEKITQCTPSPHPQGSHKLGKRRKLEKVPRKTWTEAMDIGKTLGMTDVNAALRFFHELGDVVFFDEEPLKNFIITDPSWLIEQFREVITIPKYRVNFLDSSKYWKLLDTAGLLHENVLQHVWSEEVRDELINLMMRFALLVPISSKHTMAHALDYKCLCRELKNRLYLVPSLLPSSQQSENTVCQDGDDRRLPPVILIPPEENFLPIGLTSRLIVGLINEDHWQLASKVYQDHAEFFPKGERNSSVIVGVSRKKTEVWITGKQLQGREEENEFSESLRVVLDRLDKITSSVCPQRRFHLAIRCPDCHKQKKEAIIPLEDRKLHSTEFCKLHRDTCNTSSYSTWFVRTTLDEAAESRDQGVAADRMMSAQELAAAATRVKQELHDEQVTLMSTAGIGVIVESPMFISSLRALNIIDDYHIKGIEVKSHPADKVNMLIGCLQASSRARVILFLTLLIDFRHEHQLPKSITPCIKKTLSKYTTVDQLHELEKDIDRVR